MTRKPLTMRSSNKSGNWNTAILYACVAAGGMIGSIARYAASLLLPQLSGFPLPTLVVAPCGNTQP